MYFYFSWFLVVNKLSNILLMTELQYEGDVKALHLRLNKHNKSVVRMLIVEMKNDVHG